MAEVMDDKTADEEMLDSPLHDLESERDALRQQVGLQQQQIVALRKTLNGVMMQLKGIFTMFDTE